MNIFVLDNDAAASARMMCDKHVVKMIVESCQLLSTAHHVLDGDPLEVNTGKRRYTTHICTKKNICKAAMINHPCNVWTRNTSENYLWVWKHAYALCKEYTRRYGKVHSMESMLMNELYHCPINLPKGKLTEFVQAMPDQYKNDNTVVAYRQYYLAEKVRFAKWKTGDMPNWFEMQDAFIDVDELIPF